MLFVGHIWLVWVGVLSPVWLRGSACRGEILPSLDVPTTYIEETPKCSFLFCGSVKNSALHAHDEVWQQNKGQGRDASQV